MGEFEEGSGEGGREEVKRMGRRWWLVIESRDIRLHGLLTSATIVRVDPVAEASPFLRTYLSSRRVHNSVCILYKWLFTDRVWM